MVKYKEVKFIAKQYKNRKWTVWVSRDGQKFMIGSEIRTEEEAIRLIGKMSIEREYYKEKVDVEKEELKSKIKELEEYKHKFEMLNNTLNNIVKTNSEFKEAKKFYVDCDPIDSY